MAQHAFDLDPFADGYVEEPPAPEPQSRIATERRPLRELGSRRPFLRIGHHCAIAAFLALSAAAGLTLYRRPEYWPLLLVAFVAADLALLCGVIASWLRPAPDDRRREPAGLIIFSLAVLVPTIILVVLAKADRLNPLIDGTWSALTAMQTWATERLGGPAVGGPAVGEPAVGNP